jgi:NAD(P)H-flavin reductase
MAEVKFNSNTFSLNEHESVLDCLLRNNQAIPYACKAGTCQACLVKTIDCEATEISKKWIKKTLSAQGYTLACQWVPNADVEARLPAVDEFSVKVSINKLDQLNKRTLRVILNVEQKGDMFQYFPGQYLTLINPAGVARCYSIANCYEDDQFIELHISQTQNGIFTHWLFEEAQLGDTLHIRGPAGDCFYINDEQEQFPIILAGTGTGLAPLYGIIHDALKQQHQGSISLFQGGRTKQHLYYVDELLALQEQYPQFHYYPCVIDMDGSEPSSETALSPKTALSLESALSQGTLEEVLDQHLGLGDIAQTRAYLCGNPELVHGLRKKIFLKGAKSSNIFCDPFIERNLGNL